MIPLAIKKHGVPAEVLDRVSIDCWIWTGTILDNGYGQVRLDGRRWLVHRLFYESFIGPIPEGMQLDHLCRVRACVNPNHLEPVTGRENLMRGRTKAAMNATKTHCIHGHPFNEANTYRWRGGRGCRICRNANAKKSHAKRRAP